MSRVVVLVLDSVGIGAARDAQDYGDEGAHTLAHVDGAVGGVQLPHLQSWGLGRLVELAGEPPATAPRACWRVLEPAAAGKDTTTGHWELAGLILEHPFPLYPDGFPPALIAEVERRTGRRVLGNCPASGTQIIEELGPEHLETGAIIVYTSADSVFQVAAHEEAVPLSELYAICESAREVLQGKHGVARVIARPFVGEPGAFARTSNRKDFSLPPTGPTLLDHLSRAGMPVTGVGKIEDIFAGRGLDRAVHTESNSDGMDQTLQVLGEQETGLVFVNLVDFDTRYGHRNDVEGYARALEEFDRWLPELENCLQSGDTVLITADHGCDPTYAGTDHTRERVPLLVYSSPGTEAIDLGQGETLADVAATAAGILGLPWSGPGVDLAPWCPGQSREGERHG